MYHKACACVCVCEQLFLFCCRPFFSPVAWISCCFKVVSFIVILFYLLTFPSMCVRSLSARKRERKTDEKGGWVQFVSRTYGPRYFSVAQVYWAIHFNIILHRIDSRFGPSLPLSLAVVPCLTTITPNFCLIFFTCRQQVSVAFNFILIYTGWFSLIAVV